MAPHKEGRSPGRDRPTSNPTITTTDSSRTDNASTFGAALDMPPLSTTRRCEGWSCWCHAGASTAWPLTHDHEMQRLARAIRSLDIAGGVLAL